MTAHNEDVQKVIQSLHSDSVFGLTEQQVQEKRVLHGENKLREKRIFSGLQSSLRM